MDLITSLMIFIINLICSCTTVRIAVMENESSFNLGPTIAMNNFPVVLSTHLCLGQVSTGSSAPDHCSQA